VALEIRGEVETGGVWGTDVSRTGGCGEGGTGSGTGRGGSGG
jgi:hypothetical protein